jgi:hypothetical protein
LRTGAEASKHGLDQAKEFMIGLYMVGFGAFAAATEFVYMPNVVKYMMLFDSYFGKGCFYIFWGADAASTASTEGDTSVCPRRLPDVGLAPGMDHRCFNLHRRRDMLCRRVV